ncbi:hypothetical protein DSM112329_01214 [Paraconexibacter sp. AEG42_29]|uniref:Lipoprotein n=1 Tax=Paraconexibacter sp. AEG42_29 TaxID=2997339 RepID=A0AAU7ARW2_9ACTN
MPSRRVLPLLVISAAAAGLAGCGGGSSSTTTTAADDDLASKTPQEILDASVAAVADVHSYKIRGSVVDDDGRTVISASVRDDRSVKATYTTKGVTSSYLVVRGQGFVRGDRAYWLDGRSDARSQRIARLLAGRWVKLSAGGAAALLKDVERLMPKEQAYCLPKRIGTLTKVGVRTVRGRRVVVIRDAGNVPGGTPGELSVATNGRALPMRERQTGPSRPGGTFEPRCDDTDDTSTKSDATLSHWDKVAPIRLPRNPLDPSRILPPRRTPGVPGAGPEGGLSA